MTKTARLLSSEYWLIAVKSFLFLIVSQVSTVLVAQEPETQGIEVPAAVYADLENNRFTVQIPLTKEAIQSLQDQAGIFQNRLLYIHRQELSSAIIPVLSIGFFATEDQVMDLLVDWPISSVPLQITRVSVEEHDSVLNQLSGNSPIGEAIDEPAVLFLFSSADFSQALSASRILDQARSLYAQGLYRQAALQYQLLSLMADATTAAWAKELMGLSLERIGNTELAIKAYTEVLNEFPEAAGYSRVQQRLMGLQTAAEEGQSALRRATIGADSNQTSLRGLFGQYYRTLRRSVNGSGSEEVMSLVSTDFDIRGSVRWSGHDLQARINGYSIRDALDGDKSKVRVKRVNIDYTHSGSGTNVKLGRQRDFDSGVYTSFDGVTVSYPLLESVRISVSSGKPIYFSEAYDDIDYFFYAASIDWQFSDTWKFTSYFNSQTLNSVTDREAIGWRAQFNGERVSTSLNIDYDIAFAELNNLMWSSTFRLNDATTLSAIVGKQHSPFLTASNILIGQSDLNLDVYLQAKGNVDSLLDDALARTSLSQYYSFSLNADLTDDLTLMANYYHSDLTDIPSAGFLLGQVTEDQQSSEFSQTTYGAQLIKQGLFYKSESTALGVRHSEGDYSVLNQVFINERLRFGSNTTLSPKISYSDIQYIDSSERQRQFRYSFSAIYKPTRNTELNLELGNEAITRDISDSTYDSTYLFLGYRLSF